ncbi:MAG: bifunctional DNA-formamidopyrimidine glycosylase/DNA-(apurinic or apyrimidinic site) lyase [Propionibacteriaceae bacterium]|jgi:formamidopyrimidine-DNA glycosylase|nr:bifunctional DNA-formamidopyrimidine glycosylase/DNA-(apurinic or apyrimidinic site) lyase [Propionibacteriaceae bacterium]
MPELPEVETVRRGLQRLIVGRRVDTVAVDSPRSFAASPATSVARDLLGAQITAIARRGKVLMLGLAPESDGGTSARTKESTARDDATDLRATDSDPCLVVHLKMTGQLVFRGAEEHWGGGHPSDSLVDALPDRSTRVTIGFEDGSTLFFNDQRKFGWIHLMTRVEAAALDLIATMGPEPLPELDHTPDPWPEFLSRIRRHSRTSIKAALLNQTVIAGVGNIYADEADWSAYIHPATPVAQLSDDRLRELLAGVQQVMRLSIDHGGSTDRNYVDAEGRRGSYLTFANVFRREGEPCRRCGATIIKIRVAGRGTHICPTCQPAPS